MQTAQKLKLIKIESGWYKTEDGRYTIVKRQGVVKSSAWKVFDTVEQKTVGFGGTLAEASGLLKKHLAKGQS